MLFLHLRRIYRHLFIRPDLGRSELEEVPHKKERTSTLQGGGSETREWFALPVAERSTFLVFWTPEFYKLSLHDFVYLAIVRIA